MLLYKGLTVFLQDLAGLSAVLVCFVSIFPYLALCSIGSKQYCTIRGYYDAGHKQD